MSFESNRLIVIFQTLVLFLLDAFRFLRISIFPPFSRLSLFVCVQLLKTQRLTQDILYLPTNFHFLFKLL